MAVLCSHFKMQMHKQSFLKGKPREREKWVGVGLRDTITISSSSTPDPSTSWHLFSRYLSQIVFLRRRPWVGQQQSMSLYPPSSIFPISASVLIWTFMLPMSNIFSQNGSVWVSVMVIAQNNNQLAVTRPHNFFLFVLPQKFSFLLFPQHLAELAAVAKYSSLARSALPRN